MSEGTELAVLADARVEGMQSFEHSTPACLARLWQLARVDGLSATLPAGSLPTSAERSDLEARLSRLNRATAARGLGDRFAQAMAAVLAVKAPRGGGVAGEAIRGAAYRAALADMPEAFVVAACEAALKAPSPFAPSPGEIRAWANKAMEPLRLEAHRIGMVLRATPEDVRSDEERERIRAAFAEFLEGRRPPRPVPEEPAPVAGPITVSAALRRQLSGDAGQG